MPAGTPFRRWSGRLLGYLAVCDPPEQTIGELAEALLASRSAIAGAVKVLGDAARRPPDAAWRASGWIVSAST